MAEASSVQEARWTRVGEIVREHERALWVLFVAFAATCPYYLLNMITDGRPTAELPTRLDAMIPFQEGWEFPYMAFQLMCFAPFLVIRDIDLIRRLAKAYALTYGVAYLTFASFPVRMIRSMPAEIHNFNDWMVHVNLWLDAPFNCFPSLHVSISVVAAWSIWKANPRVGIFAGLLALAIAISTLTLKQHWVADVVAGLILSNTAAWKFLWPYERTRRTALPARYALGFPAAYAVFIGSLFVAYESGVAAPPIKWESITNKIPN